MVMYQSIYLGAYAACKMKKIEEEIEHNKICVSNKHQDRVFDLKIDYCPKCGDKLIVEYRKRLVWIGLNASWDLTDDGKLNRCSIESLDEGIIIFHDSKETSKSGLYLEAERYVDSITEIQDLESMKESFIKEFKDYIEKMKEIYENVEIKTGVIIDWS